LWQREITVRGKGGKDRIVRIGHQAAAAWTGTCAPAPGTPTPGGPSCGWESTTGSRSAAGIYQMTTRRGRQGGVGAFPHRFRHHFSHTWLDRGGPEGDLMELAGWASPADAPPLRRQRPQRPRPPHLRPHHDRHLTAPAVTAPALALGAASPGIALALAADQARRGARAVNCRPDHAGVAENLPPEAAVPNL